MAAWAALLVCLAGAAAVAAEDYFGYRTEPKAWRHIAPVAHTTSQEELDAVVSQVLAHDKPEGHLDSYLANADSGEVELDVFVEMEETEGKKKHEHSPEGHARHPRHPDGYYYRPEEYLRPVVLAREYPYSHALPEADYYYEDADWPVAPARDWELKHVVSKPAVLGPYRLWGPEPLVSKGFVVGKTVDYVDRYKPVYIEKPRFRETDFEESVEKDGDWPGDFVGRKAVFVEKSVDAGIKPLPYKHVYVDGRKGWDPYPRPIYGKEYFDYGYGPHVFDKEVLVPVKHFRAKPYVIERHGGDKEFESDTVHVRDGPEGKEIVEVDKDVKSDVKKKLIVEPIVREDGVETIIAEEEDKDTFEDVKESVHLVSPYDMKE